MHKICALAYIFSATSWTGAENIKLTFASKGDDLSSTLYELFKKSEKNFVFDREIIRKGTDIKVYFNFNEVSFDSALESICRNYGLKVDEKENIYYLSFGAYNESNFFKKEKTIKTPLSLPEPNITVGKQLNTSKEVPLPQSKRLSKNVLNRSITVRFKRVDLKQLLQVLGKQAGVPIELNENVPLYRLDAFLVKTSLGFALREITHKTKLSYEFTDHGTLRIFKK